MMVTDAKGMTVVCQKLGLHHRKLRASGAPARARAARGAPPSCVEGKMLELLLWLAPFLMNPVNFVRLEAASSPSFISQLEAPGSHAPLTTETEAF